MRQAPDPPAPAGSVTQSPRRLLFVVSEDWYFCSHRLDLARAARRAGYEVAVLTNVSDYADAIRAAGLELIPFNMSRHGFRLSSELRAMREVRRAIARFRPDVVHAVAIKPAIYAGLVCRLGTGCRPARVSAFGGLGLMRSTRLRMRFVWWCLRGVLRLSLAGARSRVIVQNAADEHSLIEHAIAPPERVFLVPGAGVDLDVFAPAPPIAAPPRGRLPVVVLVARMLWAKGVADLVQAAEILAGRGVKARYLLVGRPDSGNPSCVPESVLRGWHGQYGVEWLGHVRDVSPVLRGADVACLPSYYGEGIPKALLEALACGLPIVTTDMPGCRDTVTEGENGFLVPPREPQRLADALQRLLQAPELRQTMGARSRVKAGREFALPVICEQTLEIYEHALAPA